MKNNISILLIEDDVVDQMALIEMIKKQDLPYALDYAKSVEEARLKLTSGTYDVIISDYKLADGTAFDFFDLLLDKLVIFTTGSGDEETAARALSLGVRDYLIKDPERNYLKLLSHRVDIALRQWNSELQLRESEQRYRDLVENTTDFIIILDLDGKIIYANNAWLKSLGFSHEEMIGKSILKFIQPDHRQYWVIMIRQVINGQQMNEIEVGLRAKDGHIIHAEGNANSRINHSEPKCIRIILRDLTSRVKHESERDKLLNDLQQAQNTVKSMSKLMPICSWCRKVRDDKGYWESVEHFFSKREGFEWTHGICPDCEKSVRDEITRHTASEYNLPAIPADD